MIRIRTTITLDYAVDPIGYEGSTPEEVAREERNLLRSDPDYLLTAIEEEDWSSVDVEIVA